MHASIAAFPVQDFAKWVRLGNLRGPESRIEYLQWLHGCDWGKGDVWTGCIMGSATGIAAMAASFCHRRLVKACCDYSQDQPHLAYHNEFDPPD